MFLFLPVPKNFVFWNKKLFFGLSKAFSNKTETKKYVFGMKKQKLFKTFTVKTKNIGKPKFTIRLRKFSLIKVYSFPKSRAFWNQSVAYSVPKKRNFFLERNGTEMETERITKFSVFCFVINHG